MGHGEINQEHPDCGEDEHGAETHAFGKGPGYKRGGDDGEHELVDHERLVRDGGGVIRLWGGTDAIQEQVAEVAEEGVTFREGEAIANECPEDGDQTHQREGMHDGGKHILAADQTAIEQRKPGPGHHQDQGCADQHPGVIAGGLRGLGGRFYTG